MKTMTPQNLKLVLEQQPNTLVLDVRTPAEFAEVHVPQARNLPLDEFRPKALLEAGTLFRTQQVYLLCQSGSRAVRAAEKLAREGFTEAIVIEGGTQSWIEAGLPVHRGTKKAISLERQVRIAAGSLVLTGVVLGRLLHPGFYALSAFVGAGLVFAGITDFCGMGLLLARAPWNKRPSC